QILIHSDISPSIDLFHLLPVSREYHLSYLLIRLSIKYLRTRGDALSQIAFLPIEPMLDVAPQFTLYFKAHRQPLLQTPALNPERASRGRPSGPSGVILQPSSEPIIL